jgi:hypothetical protein
LSALAVLRDAAVKIIRKAQNLLDLTAIADSLVTARANTHLGNSLVNLYGVLKQDVFGDVFEVREDRIFGRLGAVKVFDDLDWVHLTAICDVTVGLKGQRIIKNLKCFCQEGLFKSQRWLSTEDVLQHLYEEVRSSHPPFCTS